MVYPTEIPASIRPVVSKALMFAATLLKNRSVFYPFAAIHNNGNFECVFTEHESQSTTPGDMIELLQWQLIDQGMGKRIQAVLVYAASVFEPGAPEHDAIAMELSDEHDNEYLYLFTYTTAGQNIVFSGPKAHQS